MKYKQLEYTTRKVDFDATFIITCPICNSKIEWPSSNTQCECGIVWEVVVKAEGRRQI